MGSEQPHQVRVISMVKGNLSGVVDFVYDEAYITDEMMQTYLSNEGWPPEAADNMDWPMSPGNAYYNPYHRNPEVSPLKAGEVYLICFGNMNVRIIWERPSRITGRMNTMKKSFGKPRKSTGRR